MQNQLLLTASALTQTSAHYLAFHVALAAYSQTRFPALNVGHLQIPGSNPLQIPDSKRVVATSRSLINVADRLGNRSTVRMLLRWLVDEQPEQDKDEYIRTSDIIIKEMWTIKDLKDMSTSSSDVYHMATSEPFRLKDGVIRHLKDDLRRFEIIYRLDTQPEAWD